ncbi:MAG: hypothetical protein V3U52_03560 [Thermoplasmata archaeon]
MARRRKSSRGACSVVACDTEAVRSLSRRRVASALTDLEVAEGRRAYLCKDHYKKYRKATKVDRTIDRITWQ